MKNRVLSIKNKIYDGDNLVSLSNLRYLPRWIVLLIDVFIVYISLLLTFFVFQNLGFTPLDNFSVYVKYSLIITVSLLYMVVFRTYSGIIRHSTFIDLFKIFLSCVFSSITLLLLNKGVEIFYGMKIYNSSILFLHFGFAFVLLFLFRLSVKQIFHLARETRRNFATRRRILVLGISEESVALVKAITNDSTLPFQVVGFLTRRNDVKKAKLLGKKIYKRETLEKYSKKVLNIDGILINKNMLSREEMLDWVNLFLEKDLQVLKSPSVQKLRNEDLSLSIKSLQIEDLLNRKPIVIANDEIKKRHYQKAVLVTGGAGSIGSEIVRQVALFEPSLLVVLDQAETPLYGIELEMKERFPHINFKFILADISNYQRMESIFQENHFSMVYHAAAYKHVPVIEENPHEAALVNVQGSKNLALLANRYNINRFVMVSTDKAVNPTNVMGASKRMAELFVQALQNEEGNNTKFITTRFGNVLGSNGSVIPYFRKQIEKGGPVTITHPDITRYFMTIPEACELVLEAGVMGNGGEIYVFDMGEPVKIVNLAKRMIKLSGLVPDEDIKIVYTGLRPGEKLYEELLSDGTKTLPTYHEKIMISKDEAMPFQQINMLTQQIEKAATEIDKVQVVKILKQAVKDFKSNNSIFEKLDV